ncbi:MAG: Putative cytochrome C-type biogenesis protein [uncultured Phycisphaerae bacterium]|uniref:Cytochrome C-type biogenesis protein n=1 Tax=uncultured Phycisphaerae bacterium TaxID=904963 RepID=A0A6J4QHJ7_9BACT|nr:MAG: Putative cytochrome C-type biogenesis protein [uncultured Phycisphaerae bacterium]
MTPVNNTLKKVLTPLASLRITVVLIVATVLLVFAGTTAQKDMGAWDVQRAYFHTWGVMAPLKYFFPLTTWSETLGGAVPLLGGYTIALAMLVNVLAANVLRFRVGWRDLLVMPALVALLWGVGLLTYGQGYYVMTAALMVACLPLVGAAYWLHEKRGGVVLIHLGLILILLGELGTSAAAVEQQMTVDEGSSKNWAHDTRYAELAVIDRAAQGDHSRVVAIDDKLLKPGATVADPRLPFEVKVDAYYPNSTLLEPGDAPPEGTPAVTAGFGLTRPAALRQKVPGVGMGEPDFPTAYVTLTRQGREIGRYMLSAWLDVQPITVEGKTYDVALRWRRYYKPYSIHLKDFRFDRHTGTQMARNFSSDVRIVDPEAGVDREVKIWMNHPLRYRGETYYQASFDDATERTTVLQVVRNPSWLMPYIACVVGGLGMLAHFGLTLREFGRKRAKADADATAAAAAAAPRPARERKQQYTLPPRRAWASARFLVPAGALGLCLLYLIAVLAPRPVKSAEGFDLKAAAAIPVNYEGRVMPMDTLARVSLKVITGGKEDLRKVECKPPGMQFLFDTFTRNERSAKHEMFRIDNAEVISLMGLTPLDKDKKERQLFAWSELEPNAVKLQGEAIKSSEVPAKEKTAYHRGVDELWKKVKVFDSLAALGGLHVVPPAAPGGEWRQLKPAFDESRQKGVRDPGVEKFLTLLQTYGAKDAAAFNAAAADFRAHALAADPDRAGKTGVEVFFNRVAPFYHLLGFYVLVFVLTVCSFLGAPGPLRRAAWWVLVLTVLLHTGGLIFRMYLQGRPPVTTLYSSAIFVAYGGVLLAMVVERFFKNGLGLLVASVAGFVSLFVAHNLAGSDGDTLRELQAVLDTNFWLATHVVIITLGYAATFAAGLFGIVYVIRGVFTPTLDKIASKDLTRMVYGTICFAMLLSFVGTVLGGIWADQSWGRFWGWDPKENGAVLIVLWNALILHSRWAGLVRERGTVVLAIFGNIVTAWSWFGTNELGAGLHTYGFMEGTRFWLAAFAVSQLVLMMVGLLPMTAWRSGVALERNTTPGGFPAGKATPPNLPKKVMPLGGN